MQHHNTDNKYNSQARMMRGMDMLQSGATVSENEDGSFAVPSQTSADKSYEVRILGERFVCTCPDFEYRHIEACKHIHLVKFTLSVRHLHNEPKPKVFAEDSIPCTKCGSIRVIRYGIAGVHNVKQIYFCKDCRTKFREPSVLNKVKFSSELITLTLDLYFSGLSLRKIARNVNDHFDVKVGSTTIYNWIKRYVPIISEYVNSLSPQLSKTWHADEVFVRMKGSPHKGKMEGLAFLWNVMDRDTRFLLASRVSESRDLSGTVKAFQEAIANAKGQLPEMVRTDAHKSYPVGVKWAFDEVGAKVDHVKGCGIRKGVHNNNNRIERMNGTLRERVKVQRGWKSYQTPIAEGQRIAYNFVKPHQALGGKTPAMAAGIEVKGWKELIEKALS